MARKFLSCIVSSALLIAFSPSTILAMKNAVKQPNLKSSLSFRAMGSSVIPQISVTDFSLALTQQTSLLATGAGLRLPGNSFGVHAVNAADSSVSLSPQELVVSGKNALIHPVVAGSIRRALEDPKTYLRSLNHWIKNSAQNSTERSLGEAALNNLRELTKRTSQDREAMTSLRQAVSAIEAGNLGGMDIILYGRIRQNGLLLDRSGPQVLADGSGLMLSRKGSPGFGPDGISLAGSIQLRNPPVQNGANRSRASNDGGSVSIPAPAKTWMFGIEKHRVSPTGVAVNLVKALALLLPAIAAVSFSQANWNFMLSPRGGLFLGTALTGILMAFLWVNSFSSVPGRLIARSLRSRPDQRPSVIRRFWPAAAVAGGVGMMVLGGFISISMHRNEYLSVAAALSAYALILLVERSGLLGKSRGKTNPWLYPVLFFSFAVGAFLTGFVDIGLSKLIRIGLAFVGGLPTEKALILGIIATFPVLFPFSSEMSRVGRRERKWLFKLDNLRQWRKSVVEKTDSIKLRDPSTAVSAGVGILVNGIMISLLHQQGPGPLPGIVLAGMLTILASSMLLFLNGEYRMRAAESAGHDAGIIKAARRSAQMKLIASSILLLSTAVGFFFMGPTSMSVIPGVVLMIGIGAMLIIFVGSQIVLTRVRIFDRSLAHRSTD